MKIIIVIHENIKTILIGKKTQKYHFIAVMDCRILTYYYLFKEKNILVVKKDYDNGATVSKNVVH